MSKDHITQQILPELEESATSQGPKQDDGEVVAADELVPSDQEECKTPTSSNHKIPTIRSCPPTPKKKVQKLFLNKRKLPEMDFFEAANRDERGQNHGSKAFWEGTEEKVIGTVLRSSKRVVKETVKLAVIEGDTQESTQEDQNGDTEEIDVHDKEPLVRTIPVEENVEEGNQTIEISVKKPEKEAPADGSREEPLNEEERKQDQTRALSQEEPSKKDNFTEKQEPSKTTRTKKTTQEGKGQEKKKKKKRGRRGMESGGEGYKRYVFRVLKQVHPELRISSMAMSVINSLMKDMFERIADEAANLSQQSHRMTLSSREIQDAVKLVLPGELGRHAIAEGSKAITNYMSYETKGSKA
ncbi:hypothetical protein GH714_001910 [Hevea brasiliensis]|uniref:Core Histone H2A/H2B/H3 domain-containing protein n=1 Tax=Hevea brasiliensis TaxID=3981 RepID=A0A6A6NAY4_HEVBR|nr:hypothetical protein GH714_001910 [Hevea brasiliensis]